MHRTSFMDRRRLLAFWQKYQNTLQPKIKENMMDLPDAWGFGSTPEVADTLSQLVVEGTKTATCSLYWSYEYEQEPLPKSGDLSIILGGDDNPVCIIQTIEVQVRPFNQVDDQFAFDEGEGDRSLAYWRQVHWYVFSIECEQIGLEPNEDMPLVCERFKVLYKQPNAQEYDGYQ